MFYHVRNSPSLILPAFGYSTIMLVLRSEAHRRHGGDVATRPDSPAALAAPRPDRPRPVGPAHRQGRAGDPRPSCPATIKVRTRVASPKNAPQSIRLE